MFRKLLTSTIAVAVLAVATLTPVTANAINPCGGHGLPACSFSAQFYKIGDAMITRSCDISYPGGTNTNSTSTSIYYQGGQLQADYFNYYQLGQMFNKVKPSTFPSLPSWDSARSHCYMLPNNVSDFSSEYNSTEAYQADQSQWSAAYNAQQQYATGSPNWQVWQGYIDELDLIYTPTSTNITGLYMGAPSRYVFKAAN